MEALRQCSACFAKELLERGRQLAGKQCAAVVDVPDRLLMDAFNRDGIRRGWFPRIKPTWGSPQSAVEWGVGLRCGRSLAIARWPAATERRDQQLRSHEVPRGSSGSGADTAPAWTSSQPWYTTARPVNRTPGYCRASRSSAT